MALVTRSDARVTSSFLLLMPGATGSFLLLVAMPFVPSSFLLLLVVAMPGAPSSVLAPSSEEISVLLNFRAFGSVCQEIPRRSSTPLRCVRIQPHASVVTSVLWPTQKRRLAQLNETRVVRCAVLRRTQLVLEQHCSSHRRSSSQS